MKKILFIAILAIITISSAFAQRRIDPAKQIYLAPGQGYILLSDVNRELQFTRLDTITGISGGVDTLVNAGDGRYFYISTDSGDTTIIDTRAGAVRTTVNIIIGDTTYNAGANVQNLLIALSRLKITNNNDGTYTFVNNGDTTIVDTRADALPITVNISVGDTVYNSTNSVQDVLVALSNYNRNNVEGDTITQTAHGFFVGDMVGQTTGGTFFKASSDAAANFPVAFVSKVLSANRFIIRNEGWLTWAHGRTLYRDYFLQADGSFATTPDTNYNIFGFRTFGTNRAYFDVPELVVKDTTLAGGGGGGGGVTRYTRASQSINLGGLTVTTVGIVDSVGLNISTLPISTTIVDASTYVVVWDSINNRNVRVPRSVFDRNNLTTPKQIANQKGISVQIVGAVDSVGLDIVGLPIGASLTDAATYVAVWDSLANRNVRIPKSAFAGGGSGNTTVAAQVANRKGLAVQTVGAADSVGVDMSILPRASYASSAGLYFFVWDSVGARNVRIPTIGIPTFTATGSSGLTNIGTSQNANIRLGGTLNTPAQIFTDGFATNWVGADSTNSNNLIDIINITNPSANGLSGGIVYFGGKSIISKKRVAFTANNTSGSNTLFIQDNLGISFQGGSNSSNKSFFLYQLGDNIQMYIDTSSGSPGSAGNIRFDLSTSGVSMSTNNAGSTQTKLVYATPTEVGITSVNGATVRTLKITNQGIIVTGLPVYANDAAADADGTLPTGGLYKVTGTRDVRMKP